jgi:hypothetical protein
LLRFKASVSPFPPVQGRLGNPQVTAQIRDWGFHLGLFEHGHDRLDTGSRAFHGILLLPSMEEFCRKLSYYVVRKQRADQGQVNFIRLH